MSLKKSVVKVAVVQAAPILFNVKETVEKVCDLTIKASTQGAKLIVFPEAFIPAYPRGLSFGTVVGSRSDEGRELWQRYWENSIEIPGTITDKLGKIAKDRQVILSIGVTERDHQFSKGTLYCTQLYIGPNGKLLGTHRKLKPTGAERFIWGDGDGSTLSVVDTSIGKIGGLICWENYMPLARMALYNKGVEIYIASTADARDSWQSTIKHIACEGRCFVLSCNQFITKDMYPTDLPCFEDLMEQPKVMCRGGSAIISPMGEVLAGPLYDKENILFTELDMAEITRSKLDFDVIGHYARPDIFKLIVDERPKHSVNIIKSK